MCILPQDNHTRNSYACCMAQAQKHSTCWDGDRAESAREPADFMCKVLLNLSSVWLLLIAADSAKKKKKRSETRFDFWDTDCFPYVQSSEKVVWLCYLYG